MSWIDRNGNKISNLLISDIDAIEHVEWCFFNVRFNKVTQIENTSILFYLENNRKDFNVLDFIQWILDRNISFKVKYKYYHNITLCKNIKAYLLVLKLNIKIKIMGVM